MEKKQNIIFLQNNLNQNTKCEIDLIGGGITNLYLDNKHILYAGPRPDGGKAFTHPCIPNFNIATGLPNHGPARKETWKKINDNAISWEMKEITNIYLAGIKATRKFDLEDKSVTVTTTIKNTGTEDLPTNIAEHCYFACPKEEVKNIKINEISFHKKAQLADAQFNSWQDNNVLEIPEIGEIQFNTSGYNAFAQWSQPNAPFACIEPIEVIPPKSDDFFKLAPKIKHGEIKVFKYTILIK